MSRRPDPDAGMRTNRQDAGLDPPPAEGETPDVKGAFIESPIPRLDGGVNADGMLEQAHDAEQAQTAAGKQVRDDARVPGRG